MFGVVFREPVIRWAGIAVFILLALLSIRQMNQVALEEKKIRLGNKPRWGIPAKTVPQKEVVELGSLFATNYPPPNKVRR